MNAAKPQEIFDAVLDLTDEGERSALIERLCAEDPPLRARIEALLAAHRRAEPFFSECLNAIALTAEDFPIPDATDPLAEEITDDAVGSRIGPYKVMQRIGEGGHGAVYMAQQEEPVRRRVALKIIKLGMDTRSVIARFEAERQALAMMDHPGIARVYDAGATETGRPFFVMELVNGTPITEYCDANKLSTPERLELFIQVCHAIQHAHQKGIIHRDIKPSNILITMLDGARLPKVIDFGIAKAIEEKLTDKTLFTLFGHFIGTPAYMSPEQAQASAMDVDTRSDIYSLGVLLYELLTGRTPFDQKELLAAGIDEMRRTLREKEPMRPSTRVDTLPDEELTLTARRRNLDPQKLRSDLAGDLDWIVMMALEKDRNRRYQTANGLAVDVRRYLADEPITARPPTRLYRLQKLVSRNRVVFAAGMAIVVALVAGFGTSLALFLKERTAHQRAVSAERQQAKLLREAEDREKITQAAFRLSHRRDAEADELVRQVTSLRPSSEAVFVLRTLGEWHLFRGNLDRATERFDQLLKVNHEDNLWAVTDDLLRLGPLLVERGDLQGYERFRSAAISRFAGNADPVFAERVLKVSLLVPMDREGLEAARELHAVAAESFGLDPENAGTTPALAAWRCISLGLMDYRRNLPASAKKWCRKSLSYPDDAPARAATARIISAMCCQKLGEMDEALSELKAGKQLVETEFAYGLTPGDSTRGLWYDWFFARVLLREAEGSSNLPKSSAK